MYQFAGATALFCPCCSRCSSRSSAGPGTGAGASRARLPRGFRGRVRRSARADRDLWAGWWSLAGHLGAMAAADAVKAGCIAVVIVLAGAVGRVDAPAGAIACALGFAAGYAQDLIVLMLDAGVKMLLLLTVRSTVISEGLSALVGGYVRMRPALPAADHYHLFVASLLPAAIMGWAIAKGVREARPVAGALGVVGGLAISLGFAWALQVHPVFMTESRQPLPFYLVLTDASALPPLLLSVRDSWCGCTSWCGDPSGARRPSRRRLARRRRVRPGRRGPLWRDGTPSCARRAGARPGLARSSPMQEYQDPDRVLDRLSARWRIERLSGGETSSIETTPSRRLGMLHPGIARPARCRRRSSWGPRAADRAVYPDARITASPPAVRSESDRSIQRSSSRDLDGPARVASEARARHPDLREHWPSFSY